MRKKTDKISFINFDAVSSVRSCEYKIVSDRTDGEGIIITSKEIINYLGPGLRLEAPR